ncbi:unnamed protein product [Cladocopium goreaui]|uniref:RNase H type-1 domain-containing protein n=1 Tax=Cladocopium goreaui TaxID=2562237 RepID=A0A9P1CGA1_9DINO|nr:unnamed protein product [Cladocopium goreaui]
MSEHTSADLQDDIDVPITSSRPTTRLGRLDQCAVVWLEEFRYLWRDLLDPTVPFSVVVISPRPPQSRYQDYNCHVLLEQNRPQGRAAGVLTAMSREPQGLEVIQGAYSVPRFVRLDDLIETMNIQPQCEGRRCTAFHQQEPIHLVQATELTSGFSIRVQITTAMTQFPILPQSHSGEFDASVFMQRPASAAPQEVGDDPQQPATTPACPTFQFDPDAAAFVPGGLALLQTSLQRKKTLSLDELIPEELSSTDHWIPFQLLHLDFIPELPREIFLEEDATEQEVEQELQKFGHHRHAYAIGSTGKFATVPIHWHTKDHHAIYWQTNVTESTPTQCMDLGVDWTYIEELFQSVTSGMNWPIILPKVKQQMQAHRIHILGVQEARSPPGLSTADDILRETTTWTSPDGQSEHRIDFIAIPQAQLPSCTWSGIVPTLDQGNAHNDHTATALQLNWTVELPKRLKSTANVRHDRTKIAHKKGLLHFQHVKACDWQCNIETQVQELNSAIHTALTDVCPIDKTTPKKSFIDAETWELRASKLRLKRRISLAGKQARLDLMGLWFKQWKGETTVQEHNEFVQHQCTVSCVFLKLSCQYWSCTRQLKKQLQTLKNKNMQKVIEEAGYNASAGTLLHLMKPFLGSTNPKKQKRACLPIVKQADGRICADPVEAQNRWIEFFRDMEGGRRMTDLQYRDHWLQGLDHFIQTEATNIPIQDMPTLCELETALRRVQIGKAIGMDHVPPEICHYCPVQLARLCYPIMLKAAIHGQEAAEHKGGKLAIAWKQRGDVRDCQTHRSLLVSSHIGKTIHRALRQKSHHLYDAYMQRQQLGGKQKMPVSIPLHMTRAFLRWKARISASTAVVFLDLTEAFYRTLRPLAVGGEMSDHSIGLMCARLGLDSDAMHDLTQLLQEPAALAEAQAPAHVQRMLQAFHRDTWFQIGTQTDLIRTEIGSRPGDSFADVVFGLLWAKLLRKLEAHLVSFGILEFIPDIEFPTPFASEDSTAYPKIPLLGPTWMDDLSLLITAPCNEALITKTKLAVSLLLAQGPQLPAPAPQQWEDYDIPFLEALYLHLVEDETQGVLAVSLRKFICTYPISWTKCKRTLAAFCQQFTEADADVLNWSYPVIIHHMTLMQQDKYWDFLHDDKASVTCHKPATICEWEQWCTGLANQPPLEWTQWNPQPQSLTKQKILLHAFAGRRRRGDIEWYLDMLSQKMEGCVLLTVSIDIIIDSVHGDIAKEETRMMWLHHIRQGHVAGFLAGPPCNTWSRVRAVQLAGNKGPRVIRTPDAPWGLNELRIGELHQVTIGTILLGFAFEYMLAMARYSGSGVLEHPKDSEDESTVSIWRLPILQLLLQFPGMRLVNLSQGLFGAPSPKPTTLLVLRLPSLERSLHEGMLCTKLPFGITTGKDSHGNFNTAPLKEYPPGLCRAIAQSFGTDFSAHGTSAEHGDLPDLPLSFLDICTKMRDHDFGHFIGLD